VLGLNWPVKDRGVLFFGSRWCSVFGHWYRLAFLVAWDGSWILIDGGIAHMVRSDSI
jgi:hypothetical protein